MLKKLLFLIIAVLTSQKTVICITNSADKETLPIVTTENLSNLNFGYPTFESWYQACKTHLPLFRKIYQNFSNTTLTKEELLKAVEEFVHVSQIGSLSDANQWLTPQTAPQKDSPFFITQAPLNPIEPYIAKKIVNHGDTIAFHGDFHGDIHSLLEFIKFLQKSGYLEENNGFKIKESKKKNFYIVFLGDYTDRGNYGCEVIYTILRLKIENPNNIVLIRGNHEDVAISAYFGFLQEINEKFKFESFKDAQRFHQKISRIYDLLPVALYLGCGPQNNRDYIQCCHGGLEIGYNPKNLLTASDSITYQWLTKLNQLEHALSLKNISTYCADPAALYDNFVLTSPNDYLRIGFLWNDFNPTAEDKFINYNPSRGFEYGKEITDEILKSHSDSSYRIRGVFRGHQHAAQMTPMMQSILQKDSADIQNLGISKLWNSSNIFGPNLWPSIVCTFLVGPDSVYGMPRYDFPGFNFDAFGLLTTAVKFEDWKLNVYRNDIISDNINAKLFN